MQHHSSQDLKWRSEAITGSPLKKDDIWLKRSAARAFFRAVGWRDEDFAKVIKRGGVCDKSNCAVFLIYIFLARDRSCLPELGNVLAL